MDRLPPRTPPARTLRAAVALAAVLALGACGLRAETPAPVEPTPDAVEQVRARTVDDALALTQAADLLLTQATDDGVAAALTDVGTWSTAHAEALGGVYDSGLPDPAPSTGPTPTPEVPTSADEVLVGLVDAAATAAEDAGTVHDGPLARLVASVAVARGTLAQELADALGAPVPAPSEPSPTATTQEEPTPAPSDAFAQDDVAALVLAHDEAGYGFEVLAARLDGTDRDAAVSAAARHRAAASSWATTAGLTGTPRDPRRASYAVPTGLQDPAVVSDLARRLETSVADAASATIASAPAGARADLVAELTTATAAATRWGAAAVPFPGVPELAGTTGDDA